MIPQYLNIELEEGINKVITLVFKDETTNLPIDLTNYTALLRIRPSFGDITSILDITNLNLSTVSNIVLGGAAGTVVVTFKNILTSLFVSGVYDIVLTSSTGIKTKLAKGFILVDRTSSI